MPSRDGSPKSSGNSWFLVAAGGRGGRGGRGGLRKQASGRRLGAGAESSKYKYEETNCRRSNETKKNSNTN